LKSGEVWPADAQTAERSGDPKVIGRWIAIKPAVDKLVAAQEADAKKAEAEAKRAAEDATQAAEKAAKDADAAAAEEMAKLLAPPPATATAPAPKPQTVAPKAGE
jgi:hypothetical protein